METNYGTDGEHKRKKRRVITKEVELTKMINKTADDIL